MTRGAYHGASDHPQLRPPRWDQAEPFDLHGLRWEVAAGGRNRTSADTMGNHPGGGIEVGDPMASNQKGLAARIERLLEDSVGDAFARVFGGSIVPAEVESLLRREASDGVRTLPGDRFLAPNDYVITLSESDFERVSADRDLTADTFAKHLAAYIHEQGWQTYGEVVVRFEQTESLHTGQYRARAVVNPDADPRPPAPAPAPAESTHAYTAEPGVPAMTDNPNYRGQGRPGDEYYDDQYGRPQEDPRAGLPCTRLRPGLPARSAGIRRPPVRPSARRLPAAPGRRLRLRPPGSWAPRVARLRRI
jgi:hypothetical protein